MSIIFEKLAPPNTCFKRYFKSLFSLLQRKKTVSEGLKRGVFLILQFGPHSNGGGLSPPPPRYATEKHNKCCPIRQHSHLTALFEVFYNFGKIILPWFFEVFILQFVITVGTALVDSAMKTYTVLALLL